MDLTESLPLTEMPEQSGEYRLRFRYQLWSQAAQDFRSSAPARQRFASTSSTRAVHELNPRSAEPQDVSASDTVPGADLAAKQARVPGSRPVAPAPAAAPSAAPSRVRALVNCSSITEVALPPE